MQETFNKLNNLGDRILHRIRMLSGAIGLVGLLAAASYCSAETIVASDTAANYTGVSGNQGLGFGAWVVNAPGGGTLMNTINTTITNTTPGTTKAWTLWNSAANSSTTALRPFNAPLEVGGMFSTTIRIGSLDFAEGQDGFSLLDASDTVLFSYYHQAGDAGDGPGHVVDASGPVAATGFTYKYNQFARYTFTLNSPTTYTFTDNTTAATLNGTLSGAPITKVAYFRKNGAIKPINGQDFWIADLQITSPRTLPPGFVVNPINCAGMAGSTITLKAFASSSQTITYQWYHGSVQVPGATDTNLVMANVDLSKAGSYSCVATATAGSSTSSVAVVVVYPFGYTNGYDVSANYGGSFSGSQGYGFSNWVLTTTGDNGGSTGIYGGNTIGNDWFGLWNRATEGASSTALRPFKAPLPVGGTFLVDLQQNTLDGPNFQNALQLLDAAGNVLFSFYHQGGDTQDGHYIDATGLKTATGFPYSYGRVDSFAFVLNSLSSYTFYDITSGASISGTLSGAPIAAVKFVRINLHEAPANSGQDFRFNNLVLLTPNPIPPVFSVQPVNQGSMESNTVTLSALASSAQPVTYKWYHGTAELAGETKTNLVLTNVKLAQGGSYSVVASSSLGSATSSVAVVAVYPFGYTNAYDVVANYSGLSGNKGYGFNPWVVSGPGGDYVNGNGFYLWNNDAAAQRTAVRPFTDPLPVGGTFLVDLQIARNMDGPNFQSGIQLQDASGNVLFSYYHQGGDDLDGHYTDANGLGIAAGFSLAVGRIESFAFVLTSSTTYTFYNITTGGRIDGTLSGAPIAQVSFVRANLVDATTTGGHDFGFNNLVVVGPSGKPPVLEQPVASGGLVGSTITLSGAASSSVPVTYQWYKGTTPVAGATAPSLVLGNASLTSAGNYTLVATSSFGSVTSDVVSVTVYMENNRLLAYEGYNYDALFSISGQNGGSGWNGGWAIPGGDPEGVYTLEASLMGSTNTPQGFDARSVGVSLTTTAGIRAGRLLDCSNNGVLAHRGYIDAKRNIGADGKTIYVSFLLQPRDLTSFYEFEFYRGNIGDRIGGVGNDLSGSTVNLRTGGQQTPIGEGDNTAPNLYVVRIDFKAGNDDVRVYRNPSSIEEPGTAMLTLLNASDMSFNAVGVGSWNNTLLIDEIRIGATWEDALGLPASKMLPPTKTAQGWNVNFTATPDFTYRVQKANLITGPWSDFGTTTTIPEIGFGSVLDAAPSSGQTFYRVVTP